jgi:hypothetical protein
MKTWNDAFRSALVSGAGASLASSLVLAAMGKRERGDPAGPFNGPSQWVHGQAASHRRGFSVRHTVLGYLIHHLASTGWAILFERFRPPRRELSAAVVTAAVANVVDFRCTPSRFTPGFERQLSRTALVGVYAAFALGLVAVSLARRR